MTSPRPQRGGELDGERTTADALDVEALEAAGDVLGLLSAAQVYRAGRGVPRDLRACFLAYEAAARLGSAEGSYATAQFLLRGGVVPRDEKEAVGRLRQAADAGSLPAKVHLANLYEAGVYFRADSEKADVWHRSIARALGITAAVDSETYARAMADQGVGRYVMLLARQVPSAEADALKKKAAAFGWRAPSVEGAAQAAAPKEASEPMPSTSPGDVREPSPELSSSPVERAATAASPVRPRRTAPSPKRRGERIGGTGGVVRWLFLDMFAAAALGAADLVKHGAEILVNEGRPVPLVGSHLEWIVPAVLAALVLLPASLLYRAATVVRSLVVAILAAVGGALSWGHLPHLLPAGVGASRVAALSSALLGDPAAQATIFALAGFLAGMLAFGFRRAGTAISK